MVVKALWLYWPWGWIDQIQEWGGGSSKPLHQVEEGCGNVQVIPEASHGIILPARAVVSKRRFVATETVSFPRELPLLCSLSVPFFQSLSFYLFIFLWPVLGLHCLWQVGATLHCSAQASHCSGLSCGTQALGMQASVVVEHGLSCPKACRILLDQGSNLCSCVGRWTLNLWTTREGPYHFNYYVGFEVF